LLYLYAKILGLSKLVRISQMFSRRLQVQERLGVEITDAIEKLVNPLGIALLLECKHMCKIMRGVQQPNSKTVTNIMRGKFDTDVNAKEQFFNLIRL